MKQLKKFLDAKQCNRCFIDVTGFPVYVMKCPEAVSESIKRWIDKDRFVFK
ncbi:hypothetical protein [Planomicrobium sp. CPCC 101110]|uniref:hypothetical protein n=1 Tax=Planomicrobium sp. CPCC 101110 TaxID=2599619 RepID=UPI0016454A0F|nr:hypothetical protein [Planomicrobium sp. CPCC 101110]